MSSVQPEAEVPSTVEIDRRRLNALEGQRKELYATQRVLAVIAERLMKQTGDTAITVETKEFDDAPDLRAERRDGVVHVTVFR